LKLKVLKEHAVGLTPSAPYIEIQYLPLFGELLRNSRGYDIV